MLHYVHQLLAKCICVLFGAEQVVYSWFKGKTVELWPDS